MGVALPPWILAVKSPSHSQRWNGFLVDGLSANLSATCKAAEDDCLERRNSIRPCVPSHVAYKAERGGNELFWSPWKNVSTLARAAPKPRGHGVSASIRWRRA